MENKICRPNFLELGGFTFSFNMTNHLNPLKTEDESLTEICHEISGDHPLMFPNWTRLQTDFRIIRITAENKLFQYLNENFQQKCLNWLIFSQVNNKIIVTHFGPFGKKKDKDIEDKVEGTRLSLKKLKDVWLQLSSTAMPKEEKETKQKEMMNDIKKNFWAMMQAVEEQIEAKKREMKEAIMTGFDSTEDRDTILEYIVKITTKSRAYKKVLKAVMKKITAKIATAIAKTAAKQTAKQGAKAVSKGAAKTTAKAVPFLGLVLGLGFAIGRLIDGDVAGAGLEVASGAASCVPGAGTAASLAIDTGLVVKDVKNTVDHAKENKEKMEALKADVERFEAELNNLFTEYDTAKAEYDFVCEVLGDPGYNFEKLEHDIGVVDEVLRELHTN